MKLVLGIIFDDYGIATSVLAVDLYLRDSIKLYCKDAHVKEYSIYEPEFCALHARSHGIWSVSLVPAPLCTKIDPEFYHFVLVKNPAPLKKVSDGVYKPLVKYSCYHLLIDDSDRYFILDYRGEPDYSVVSVSPHYSSVTFADGSSLQTDLYFERLYTKRFATDFGRYLRDCNGSLFDFDRWSNLSANCYNYINPEADYVSLAITSGHFTPYGWDKDGDVRHYALLMQKFAESDFCTDMLDICSLYKLTGLASVSLGEKTARVDCGAYDIYALCGNHPEGIAITAATPPLCGVAVPEYAVTRGNFSTKQLIFMNNIHMPVFLKLMRNGFAPVLNRLHIGSSTSLVCIQFDSYAEDFKVCGHINCLHLIFHEVALREFPALDVDYLCLTYFTKNIVASSESVINVTNTLCMRFTDYDSDEDIQPTQDYLDFTAFQYSAKSLHISLNQKKGYSWNRLRLPVNAQDVLLFIHRLPDEFIADMLSDKVINDFNLCIDLEFYASQEGVDRRVKVLQLSNITAKNLSVALYHAWDYSHYHVADFRLVLVLDHCNIDSISYKDGGLNEVMDEIADHNQNSCIVALKDSVIGDCAFKQADSYREARDYPEDIWGKPNIPWMS